MVKISGGDKLNVGLSDIAKKLSKGTLRVGFLEDATYPDGTSVGLVAAVQEFGSPSKGIPPRPFFRNMIAAHSKEWPDEIATALKLNGFDAVKALDSLGELISAELAESIQDLYSPSLSPVTIMLRGMRTQAQFRDLPFWQLIGEARERVAAGKTNYGASVKPLIDTGHLENSIRHDVT
jgi:hypothetical protein